MKDASQVVCECCGRPGPATQLDVPIPAPLFDKFVRIAENLGENFEVVIQRALANWMYAQEKAEGTTL